MVLTAEAISKPECKIVKFPTVESTRERDLTYSEYTSRGVKKASAADSVRSLDDIRAIRNFYLDNGRLRDYAMFTVGICSGLRISDICRLKISDLINEDGTFKEYISIREKKTGKASVNADDKCLITEAMREAISLYLESRPGYSLSDPFLYSQKAGSNCHSITESTGYRALSDAAKALNIPIHLSSHSMRKSFANIAACVGEEAEINMPKLLSVQHMLKHSDYKTTMRYLRLTSVFTERARNNVSDFVLGKTDKNNLTDSLFDDKDTELEKLDQILEAINKLTESPGGI